MSWHEELLSVASLFLLSSLFYCTCSSAVPFSLLPRLFNPTSLIGSTSRLNSVARIRDFRYPWILSISTSSFLLQRRPNVAEEAWSDILRCRLYWNITVGCGFIVLTFSTVFMPILFHYLLTIFIEFHRERRSIESLPDACIINIDKIPTDVSTCTLQVRHLRSYWKSITCILDCSNLLRITSCRE